MHEVEQQLQIAAQQTEQSWASKGESLFIRIISLLVIVLAHQEDPVIPKQARMVDQKQVISLLLLVNTMGMQTYQLIN